MASASRRTSRFSLGAEVALVGLVVLGPLALGGAPVWVLWPLVGLATVAAVLAAVGARRQGHPLHVPLLALPLVAGAVLCLAQLVPLPPGLLARVSPEAAALREFALVPLGLTSARPISLEPSATWRELAKSLAYVLAFVAAVQVCRSRRSRRRLLATLAFAGGAVALVGLVHEVLGLASLFGLRAYTHARPPLVTPFGNPNHLAGFLGLAATVGLGLALTAERRGRSVLFAAAALLSGAGVLLSLSRAGIVFFLFGQGLVVLGALRQRRSRRVAGPWRLTWSGGALGVIVLGASLAVGGYVAWEELAREAATADSVAELRQGKVELWPMMAEAARAFPVLGMGRGAFEVGFGRYQTQPNPNTLTHPENAVLQLAAEFGVPGLGLLAVLAWGFVRLLRRARQGRTELAVLAGVLALGLHNLFDFSLELPACAVAALVALAAVARPEEGSEAESSPEAWSLSPARGLSAAGVMGLLALGALVPGRHTLAAAEAELAGLVRDRAPLEEVRARGLRLIDRHPADYLLPGLIGSAYARGGKATAEEALAFVNRALYLRPMDAGSHRAAARALLALGHRGQAFLEYRLAHEAGDTRVLVSEALDRTRTVEELQVLTPASVAMAADMAAALSSRPARQEQALGWLAWARERFEGVPGVEVLWEREARLRMARGELGEAEALCAELEHRAPEALGPPLLRADILRRQGRKEDSLQLLERLVPRFPGKVELSFALANQLLEVGLTRRARDVLAQASPFAMDYAQRARLLALEGACFEREGLLSRALERYQTVARLMPAPEAHFTVARLHETLRRYDEAARAAREGVRLLPLEARREPEEWVARLEEKQRQLTDERQQQLLNNPREQEVEHLLRATEPAP